MGADATRDTSAGVMRADARRSGQAGSGHARDHLGDRYRQSRKVFATKPGSGFPVKGHPRGGIDVTQCVESFHPLRRSTVHKPDGQPNALAHNPDGPIAVSTTTNEKGSRSHGG
ncbi:hypothetical protein GCM10023114_29490 [Mycolicibacterium sediminis]|uniref:Uncharacterized protein n=1 Tax=Mycolicibacterium sediminis TaxID=1286180 RepID=A0A7I7QY46_9MYCO|nr:hypothetical protein MSEDJ_50330 [Mycolicibacterium sediminis]